MAFRSIARTWKRTSFPGCRQLTYKFTRALFTQPGCSPTVQISYCTAIGSDSCYHISDISDQMLDIFSLHVSFYICYNYHAMFVFDVCCLLHALALTVCCFLSDPALIHLWFACTHKLHLVLGLFGCFDKSDGFLQCQIIVLKQSFTHLVISNS